MTHSELHTFATLLHFVSHFFEFLFFFGSDFSTNQRFPTKTKQSRVVAQKKARRSFAPGLIPVFKSLSERFGTKIIPKVIIGAFFARFYLPKGVLLQPKGIWPTYGQKKGSFFSAQKNC